MNDTHDPDCEAGGMFEVSWPFGGGKHDTKEPVAWPSHEQCVRENKMPICIQRQMGAHVRRVADQAGRVGGEQP